MPQSPYQHFATEKPALLERLAQNPDLCNVVLALLGRCIVLCAERGLPIEGVEFSELQANDLPNHCLALRSRLTFHALPVTAASIWPPQSDFARYTRSKAFGLGMALQKNPKLNQFFQAMVVRIESFADHRGFQFRKLKVQKALITTSDVLVLQVGINVLTN